MYRTHAKNPFQKFLFFQLLFFIAVFLSGYFIADYLQTHFPSDNQKQFALLIEELNHLTPFRSEIYFYCLYKQIKHILFLFFFSTTNLWNWFQKVFLGYVALSQSFLLHLCYHTNGFSGIPEYLLFLFPECLIFIPLYLYLFYHLRSFHNDFLHTSNPQTSLLLFLMQKKRESSKENSLLLYT